MKWLQANNCTPPISHHEIVAGSIRSCIESDAPNARTARAFVAKFDRMKV